MCALRQLTAALWLAERQAVDGGLNGRPDKPTDTCYAWWVLAALRIIGRTDLIDRDGAIAFVLSRQCEEGGFSAHAGRRADLFHTHFAIAALAVVGHPGVGGVDPVLCMRL